MIFFTERHQKVADKIKKEYLRLSKKHHTISFAKNVGNILKVSPMTIVNYMHGRVKDGYLAEAILAELKKIK